MRGPGLYLPLAGEVWCSPEGEAYAPQAIDRLALGRHLLKFIYTISKLFFYKSKTRGRIEYILCSDTTGFFAGYGIVNCSRKIVRVLSGTVPRYQSLEGPCHGHS